MDEEESSESEDQQLDLQPLSLGKENKIKLNVYAESMAIQIASKMVMTNIFNGYLDVKNEARSDMYKLVTKSCGDFEHFLQKNRYESERRELLYAIRYLLYVRKIIAKNRIIEKYDHQTMVVRFVQKVNNSNVMLIEDETGREKIAIKRGVVWVGLICCIETTWVDSMYRLDRIVDMGERVSMDMPMISYPMRAYRMLVTKGPFWDNKSSENVGLKIIITELARLRDKERIIIDCLIVMGPLLSVDNQLVSSCGLENSYEMYFYNLVYTLKIQASVIFRNIQIVIVPSTSDVTNFYPIPQPKYYCDYRSEGLSYVGNPGIIELTSPGRKFRIDLLNTDIIRYIDENRTGSATDLLQENLETYFQQPFYVSNTLEEPFDYINLAKLYNQGLFGNLVITSSQYSPPYAREVKGRLFVNIGSLGMDYHMAGKHYMTLLSLYDGGGNTAKRIKVDTLAL